MADYVTGDGPSLRGELDRGIGHYMAWVAEHLLRQELPVTSIAAYSDFTDPLQVEHQRDVEGAIFFSDTFQEALLKGPGTAQLHWCAVSGWGLFLSPDTPYAAAGTFRWLREGLVPPPADVAAFVFDAWTDLSSKSSERPMYRVPGQELKHVAHRLLPFVPEAASPYVDDYVFRFARRLSETYRDRILAALLEPRQDKRAVVLSEGEIAALRLAAEFIKATQVAPETTRDGRPAPGPGRLAELLATDVALRAGHSNDPQAAAENYSAAREQAFVDRSSLGEHPL